MAVVDAGCLGDGCQRLLAFLFAFTVDHGEEIVVPVRVSRALIGMADGAEARHFFADRFERIGVVLRSCPDAHGIGAESCLAVVEHGGKAAHASGGEEFRVHRCGFIERQAQCLGDSDEGFGNQIDVALHQAHKGDFRIGECCRFLAAGLGVFRFAAVAGFSGPFNIEADADFKQLQRWQEPGGFGPGKGVEFVHGRRQAELAGRWHGNRVPEVELVVAQVIVADARVGVDHADRGIELFQRDAGGDEAGGVAEAAGIENRADLADDLALLELHKSLNHIGFREAAVLADRFKRPLHKRYGFLQQAEELGVVGIGRVHCFSD